jgi:hypothetical protein
MPTWNAVRDVWALRLPGLRALELQRRRGRDLMPFERARRQRDLLRRRVRRCSCGSELRRLRDLVRVGGLREPARRPARARRVSACSQHDTGLLRGRRMPDRRHVLRRRVSGRRVRDRGRVLHDGVRWGGRLLQLGHGRSRMLRCGERPRELRSMPAALRRLSDVRARTLCAVGPCSTTRRPTRLTRQVGRRVQDVPARVNQGGFPCAA